MNIYIGKYENCINLCRKDYLDGFFEFDLPYVSENDRFREIDRFLWESRHLTRFKNRYTGPIVVDISTWNEKFPNDYFKAFLLFIKDIESQLCPCTFISSNMCCEQIISSLKNVFDINIISLESNKNKGTKIGFLTDEVDK